MSAFTERDDPVTIVVSAFFLSIPSSFLPLREGKTLALTGCQGCRSCAEKQTSELVLLFRGSPQFDSILLLIG